MKQNIILTELTHQPSDYQCIDGQLDLAVNAINENGYIEPLKQPTLIVLLEALNSKGFEVLYAHNGKYILRFKSATGNLLFYDPEQKILTAFPDNAPAFAENEIKQTTSIGNILIVISNETKHHFKWNEDNYTYIGEHMPELKLRFGLKGEYFPQEDVDIQEYYVSFGDYAVFLDNPTLNVTGQNENIDADQAISNLTESVMAKVNKLVNEQATKKGKFIFPFFVRYAFRLYDQTLTMHSPPILMTPSSNSNPMVIASADIFTKSYAVRGFNVTAIISKLVYDAIGNKSDFDNWSDIIKSVDIFISAPIYTYLQNEKVKKGYFIFSENNESNGIAIADIADNKNFSPRYIKDIIKDYNFKNLDEDTLKKNVALQLPHKPHESIIDEVKNVSTFYLLKSINIEDLNFVEDGKSFEKSYKEIEIQENYLTALQARETMTDDFDSHDEVIPKFTYTYNSRINYANIFKKPFKGFNTDMAYITPSESTPNLGDMFVELSTENGTIITQQVCTQLYFPYYYYPGQNAKHLYIKDGDKYYKFKLEKSNFLNGSFWFGAWANQYTKLSLPETVENIPKSTTQSIELQNKLYTSEVNNPFVFPPKGIQTVGQTEITGVSTATKALSQGQFGQFPLYIFSNEGIWAMEVNSEGWFKPEQPVSREICINPKAITQIDGAVLFISDKGLMLLEGSNTACLSTKLDNQQPFSLSKLPKYDKLKELCNFGTYDDTTPHVEFLRNASILYDYRHQRLYISNEQAEYGYIFSLKTKTWTTQTMFKIISTLNTYPGAIAVIQNETNGKTYDRLVDFSQLDNNTTSNALIVTRPIKLGDPDALKTINNIFVRGSIDRENVKLILFGTRDYNNYSIIASADKSYIKNLTGTPYKAFRIAIIAQFGKNENFENLTIEFTPKWTNTST